MLPTTVVKKMANKELLLLGTHNLNDRLLLLEQKNKEGTYMLLIGLIPRQLGIIQKDLPAFSRTLLGVFGRLMMMIRSLSTRPTYCLVSSPLKPNTK